MAEEVYRGYRYIHVETRMTYDAARQHCESQNAYLASVYSKEDASYLRVFTAQSYRRDLR